MGYVYGSDIERVALYLIELLQEKGSVSYDFFYDGTDETHEKLNKRLGFSNEGDQIAEALLDFAIFDLKGMGIVKTIQLKSKLADGEFNYRTTLTNEGKEIIKSGKKLEFRDFEA